MARSFNGSSDELQCSDHSALNSLTTGTVAVRLKPSYSGSPSSIRGIYAKEGTGSVALYGAYHYTDGYLYHDLAGAGATGVGPWSPTSGTWYAFVFLWNGSKVRCFINGSLDGDGSNANGSGSNSRPFYIGCWSSQSGGSKYRWYGSLAEFSVWKNYVLTSDEITALSRGVLANKIRPDKLSLYCPIWGTG